MPLPRPAIPALALALLLGLGFGLFRLARQPDAGEAPPASAHGPAGSAAEDDSPALPQVAEEDGLTVLRGTDFDLHYLSPERGALDDLRLVEGLWQDAMLLIKDFDSLPLAENRDFVALWQGANSHRVAWIPPGHAAVSADGELLDRWGAPLFFHRESSRATTLRSAGPDGVLWTADDVVLEAAGAAGER